MKLVTTTEIAFTFFGASSRFTQADEDMDLEFGPKTEHKLQFALDNVVVKNSEVTDGEEGNYEGEDGHTYTGTFKNGVPHGEGNERIEKGYSYESYEGSYENGKRNGEGCYKWGDNDSYTGSWKDGKMHGQGELSVYMDYTTKNYNGEFVNGLMHG